MSQGNIDELALLLFQDYELPQSATKVIEYMIYHPITTYEQLSTSILLPVKELNDSLSLLIYDNIISFQTHNFVFDKTSCLHQIRRPQILKFIKCSLGTNAFNIVITMMNEPLRTKEEIFSKIKPTLPETLDESFDLLVREKYIHSIALSTETKIEKPEHKIQKAKNAKLARKSNKKNTTNEEPVMDVVLTINYTRILYDIRTSKIYNFVKNRYSLQSAEIIKAILEHTESTTSQTICSNVIS